jgi:hypothetical protein
MKVFLVKFHDCLDKKYKGKCLELPPNGRRAAGGGKNFGDNAFSIKACDATNWRQFFVISDGVVKNPVVDKCIGKAEGALSPDGIWESCGSFPSKMRDADTSASGVQRWHIVSPNPYDHDSTSHEWWAWGWSQNNPHDSLKMANVQQHANYFARDEVPNPEQSKAPWDKPQGKNLLLALRIPSANDMVSDNTNACAFPEGDTLMHGPCQWLDKKYYWEQLPNGVIKNVGTGKCMSDIMVDCNQKERPWIVPTKFQESEARSDWFRLMAYKKCLTDGGESPAPEYKTKIKLKAHSMPDPCKWSDYGIHWHWG